jgi:large subunit ribosomal protein L4
VAAGESKKKVDATTPGTTGTDEAKAAAPKAAKPRAVKPKAAPEAAKPKAEAKAAKPKADKVAAPKAAKPKAAKPKAAKPKAERAASPKTAKPKPAKAKAEKPEAEKAAEPEVAKPAKVRKTRAAKAKVEKAAPPVRAERPPKPVVERTVHEPRRGKAGSATVVDESGKEVATRDLVPTRFAVPADVNALHLVVRGEQAARRRGTASTKTRGEVSGSTAKLFRQKGTGRARAGSVKSPIRTGGGTAFGPRPRSFFIKVNRKVVKKALAMALSNRAENGNLFVAAGLELDAPSTRRLNDLLTAIDCAAPVLVVTHDEPAVSKSVRNLFYAETAEVGGLSTEQVLRARSLVLTEKAFDALNQA